MVEEGELLLVAQHLDGRLAQNREVECGPLRGGIRKHDLMGEGGFTASGRPGNDIERVFRQPAAQDLIQTGHAGRQAPDRHTSCGAGRGPT